MPVLSRVVNNKHLFFLSLTFVLGASLRSAAARADVDNKLQDGANEACIGLWNTIAVDPNSDANRLAQMIHELISVKPLLSASLAERLDDEALTKAKAELSAVVVKLSSVCGKLRDSVRGGRIGWRDPVDGSFFPYCPADTPDPSHSGWGWDRDHSCRVQDPANPPPTEIVWVDAKTGLTRPYCQDPTSDPAGTGWGWEHNASCKAPGGQGNAVIDPTVFSEFHELLPDYRHFSKQVVDHLIAPLSAVIRELQAGAAAGTLKTSSGPFDVAYLLNDVKAFADFWQITGKAWDRLYDRMEPLERFTLRGDTAAAIPVTCPANACVFQEVFCYDPSLQLATTSYEGSKWYWWGNGTLAPGDVLGAGVNGFIVSLYDAASNQAIQVETKRLALANSARGICRIDDLKNFDLSRSPLATPATPPLGLPDPGPASPDGGDPLPPPAGARPPAGRSSLSNDVSGDTQLFEQNSQGIGLPCRDAGLLDREARWLDTNLADAASEGKKKVSAGLVACRDGALVADKDQQPQVFTADDDAVLPQLAASSDDCLDVGLRSGEAIWTRPLNAARTGTNWLLRRCIKGHAVKAGLLCSRGFYRSGQNCVAGTLGSAGLGGLCTDVVSSEAPTWWQSSDDGGMSEAAKGVRLSCDAAVHPELVFCYGHWLASKDPGSSPLCSNTAGGDAVVEIGPLTGLSPKGGIPGSGNTSLNAGGVLSSGLNSAATGDSAAWIELATLLVDEGVSKLAGGDLWYQHGCLTFKGQCLHDPAGGTFVASADWFVLAPNGSKLSCKNQGLIKVSLFGQIIRASDGKRAGNCELIYDGGASVTVNHLPVTSGHKPGFVNLGTGLGVKPGSTLAPVNLKSPTGAKPNFLKPDWIVATSNPSSGLDRPDAVNRPEHLGAGGASYRSCHVDGVIHRHGTTWHLNLAHGDVALTCNKGVVSDQVTCERLYKVYRSGDLVSCAPVAVDCVSQGQSHASGSSWSVAVKAGQATYHCTNGEVTSAVSCDSGATLVGGTCKIGCAWDDHSYPHGDSERFRLARTKGPGTGGWTCNDGHWDWVGPIACDDGFKPGGDGDCVAVYKDCDDQGTLRHHGDTWSTTIANGTATASCQDGTIKRTISCQDGATAASGECKRSCAWSDVYYDHGSTHQFRLSADKGPGSGVWTCNDSAWDWVGPLTCDAGYVGRADGTCQAVVLPCVDGDRTHASGDTWEEPIANGTVTATCTNGTINRRTSCARTATWSRDACRRSCYWNDVAYDDGFVGHFRLDATMGPGSGVWTCNDAKWDWNGPLTCDDGYTGTADGKCVLQHKACYDGDTRHEHGESWTKASNNGTVTATCHEGTIDYGNTQCNDGSSLVDGSCRRTCSWDGTFNHGYVGHFRIRSDWGPGSGVWTCNEGNWDWNGPLTCDDGYTATADGKCVLQHKPCYDGDTRHEHGESWTKASNNGTVTATCHDGTIDYGNTQCDEGSTWVDGSCKRTCSWNGTFNHGYVGHFRIRSDWGPGSGVWTCSAGEWVWNGPLTCDDGYHATAEGHCDQDQRPAPTPTQPQGQCYENGNTYNNGATWNRAIFGGNISFSCSFGNVRNRVNCYFGYHEANGGCALNQAPAPRTCSADDRTYSEGNSVWMRLPAFRGPGYGLQTCRNGSWVDAFQTRCDTGYVIGGFLQNLCVAPQLRACQFGSQVFAHGTKWTVPHPRIAGVSVEYQCNNGTTQLISSACIRGAGFSLAASFPTCSP